MLQSGDRLGDWIIEGSLGQGAMGSVYKCHHVVTGRLRAAVKVVNLADVAEGGRWFLREVEALARLDHPGVVGIRSPGVDAQRGMMYIAMELVEGETLLTFLKRGPLPVTMFRQVFGGVAAALAFAHAHGIYHRDLKPSNIMIRPDGSPVLVDFGVAVDLEAGEDAPETRIGTPSYMPPESFLAGPVDPAKADIYALGVLMFEALTARRAFERVPGGDETHYQAIRRQKIATASLDPGDPVPSDLRLLIRASTAPWPADRTITPDTLSAALLRGGTAETLVPMDSMGTATRPAPAPSMDISGTLATPDEGREMRRWILGAVIVAFFLSLLAGGLAWWWAGSVP